jgi:translation initiation factor IF-2
VIVGARSAGPKILGFIDVSKNRPSGGQRRDGARGGKPGEPAKPSEAAKPSEPAKPSGGPAPAVELVDGDRPQGRASARKAREVKQARRLPGRKPVRGDGRPTGSGTAEMSAEKKRVRVDEAISVGELAKQMGVKAPKVIRALYGMGIRKVTVNSTIDVETAELVANEFGYRVEDVSFDESELIDDEGDELEGEPRAPVIAVLGHVDHGKTTLLDRLRRANVAGGEAGGITQHVGAYRVETIAGPMVFVDTPGHSAFSAMRERGANLTDIAIVIIAANDGIMPTTIEALDKVKQAEVELIIAANKVDLPDANLPRLERQLMEQGILTETYGGDVPLVPISAKHGQGIDTLLEQIGVRAELLDLRANPEGRAIGAVLESRIDRGRGVIATVLVQNGTLERGDIIVAGESSGRVSALVPTGMASLEPEERRGDDEPKDKKKDKKKDKPAPKAKPTQLERTGPSTVVDVVGFDEPPPVGAPFNVVEDDKAAKLLVNHRREQRKRREGALSGAPSFADRLAAERRAELPTLALVVRADVQGSLEAIEQIIEGVRTSKIHTKVISTGVGAITEGDVKLAASARQSGTNVRPAIFGFGVKAAGKVATLADSESIPICSSKIIYELGEQLQKLMLDQLEPTYVEHPIGRAEVRKTFPTSHGVVCGCRVVSGKITRTAGVRVIRGGEVVKHGKIASLRIVDRDVREVLDGHECGVLVAEFEGAREGDVIEAYELEAIPPTL